MDVYLPPGVCANVCPAAQESHDLPLVHLLIADNNECSQRKLVMKKVSDDGRKQGKVRLG